MSPGREFLRPRRKISAWRVLAGAGLALLAFWAALLAAEQIRSAAEAESGSPYSIVEE